MKALNFDMKHVKKVEGCIGLNIVNIIMWMMTLVRIHSMENIILSMSYMTCIYINIYISNVEYIWTYTYIICIYKWYIIYILYDAYYTFVYVQYAFIFRKHIYMRIYLYDIKSILTYEIWYISIRILIQYIYIYIYIYILVFIYLHIYIYIYIYMYMCVWVCLWERVRVQYYF